MLLLRYCGDRRRRVPEASSIRLNRERDANRLLEENREQRAGAGGACRRNACRRNARRQETWSFTDTFLLLTIISLVILLITGLEASHKDTDSKESGSVLLNTTADCGRYYSEGSPAWTHSNGSIHAWRAAHTLDAPALTAYTYLANVKQNTATKIIAELNVNNLSAWASQRCIFSLLESTANAIGIREKASEYQTFRPKVQPADAEVTLKAALDIWSYEYIATDKKRRSASSVAPPSNRCDLASAQWAYPLFAGRSITRLANAYQWPKFLKQAGQTISLFNKPGLSQVPDYCRRGQKPKKKHVHKADFSGVGVDIADVDAELRAGVNAPAGTSIGKGYLTASVDYVMHHADSRFCAKVMVVMFSNVEDAAGRTFQRKFPLPPGMSRTFIVDDRKTPSSKVQRVATENDTVLWSHLLSMDKKQDADPNPKNCASRRNRCAVHSWIENVCPGTKFVEIVDPVRSLSDFLMNFAQFRRIVRRLQFLHSPVFLPPPDKEGIDYRPENGTARMTLGLSNRTLSVIPRYRHETHKLPSPLGPSGLPSQNRACKAPICGAPKVTIHVGPGLLDESGCQSLPGNHFSSDGEAQGMRSKSRKTEGDRHGVCAPLGARLFEIVAVTNRFETPFEDNIPLCDVLVLPRHLVSSREYRIAQAKYRLLYCSHRIRGDTSDGLRILFYAEGSHSKGAQIITAGNGGDDSATDTAHFDEAAVPAIPNANDHYISYFDEFNAAIGSQSLNDDKDTPSKIRWLLQQRMLDRVKDNEILLRENRFSFSKRLRQRRRESLTPNWTQNTPFATYGPLNLGVFEVKNGPDIAAKTKPLRMLLDETDICKVKKNQRILAVVVYASAASAATRRQEIRDAVKLPTIFRRVFFHGRPVKNPDYLTMCFDENCEIDTELDNALHEESRIHRDIVQADFLDVYLNLTSKTTAAIRWFNERCGKSADFFVKIDLDTFIAPRNYANMLFDLRYRNLLAPVSRWNGLLRRASPANDKKWFELGLGGEMLGELGHPSNHPARTYAAAGLAHYPPIFRDAWRYAIPRSEFPNDYSVFTILGPRTAMSTETALAVAHMQSDGRLPWYRNEDVHTSLGLHLLGIRLSSFGSEIKITRPCDRSYVNDGESKYAEILKAFSRC